MVDLAPIGAYWLVKGIVGQAKCNIRGHRLLVLKTELRSELRERQHGPTKLRKSSANAGPASCVRLVSIYPSSGNSMYEMKKKCSKFSK